MFNFVADFDLLSKVKSINKVRKLARVILLLGICFLRLICTGILSNFGEWFCCWYNNEGFV